MDDPIQRKDDWMDHSTIDFQNLVDLRSQGNLLAVVRKVRSLHPSDLESLEEWINQS
jgi:hypothetical protein